jgi:hypothetical protein
MADLQKLARHIEGQLPDDCGFILLAFEFGSDRRMHYVSNASRAHVVDAMKEFIAATEGAYGAHEFYRKGDL